MKTLDNLVDEMNLVSGEILKISANAANLAALEDKVFYLVKMEDILYNYTKDKSILPIPCEEFGKDRKTLINDVKKLYSIYNDELAVYERMQELIKQMLNFGKVATRYLLFDFVEAVIDNKHEIKSVQKYMKRIMVKCGLMTKEDFIENKTEELGV